MLETVTTAAGQWNLAPRRPQFRDIVLLNPRAGRIADDEIIALNNQGANSRRLA
jgi:hypothetical protein